MEIINNKKEYELFYYYNSTPKFYPEKYPCVCDWDNEDGGIGGGYKQHRVIYPPDGVNIEIFLECVKQKWKDL